MVLAHITDKFSNMQLQAWKDPGAEAPSSPSVSCPCFPLRQLHLQMCSLYEILRCHQEFQPLNVATEQQPERVSSP